jgi:hypothetical protein
MADSHIDIDMVQRSPIFSRLVEGNAPVVNHQINGHSYDKDNYLVDGIYLDWSTLVKTIHAHEEEKNKRAAKQQEACSWKDVEQAFYVS